MVGQRRKLDPEPSSPRPNAAGSRRNRRYRPLKGFHHNDCDVETVHRTQCRETPLKVPNPVFGCTESDVRQRLAQRRPFRSLRFPQSNFEKWVGSFLHCISRNIAHREAFLFGDPPQFTSHVVGQELRRNSPQPLRENWQPDNLQSTPIQSWVPSHFSLKHEKAPQSLLLLAFTCDSSSSREFKSGSTRGIVLHHDHAKNRFLASPAVSSAFAMHSKRTNGPPAGVNSLPKALSMHVGCRYR